MNRPADAKKLFQDKINKDANDADSMQALAALYASDKDYDNATRLLSARPGRPRRSGSAAATGGPVRAAEKWPDAIREARGLVTTVPGDMVCAMRSAAFTAEAGDLPNSVQAYKDGGESVSQFGGAAGEFGAGIRRCEGLSDRTAAMSKAISLAPRDDRLKAAQISISYAAGGADRALATATSFTKENPQDPTGDILSADVLDRIRQARSGHRLAREERWRRGPRCRFC
jgi:predicted Zn-dependent protease